MPACLKHFARPELSAFGSLRLEVGRGQGFSFGLRAPVVDARHKRPPRGQSAGGRSVPFEKQHQRLAGGPLLFPGMPCTFAGSWSWVELPWLDPTVPCRAAGPFLLPGAPLMPAPEFFALVAPLTSAVGLVLSGWPGACAAAPGFS